MRPANGWWWTIHVGKRDNIWIRTIPQTIRTRRPDRSRASCALQSTLAALHHDDIWWALPSWPLKRSPPLHATSLQVEVSDPLPGRLHCTTYATMRLPDIQLVGTPSCVTHWVPWVLLARLRTRFPCFHQASSERVCAHELSNLTVTETQQGPFWKPRHSTFHMAPNPRLSYKLS